MNKKNDLDFLSDFQASDSLWDAISHDTNINNLQNLILHFEPERKYTLRFLGPFINFDRAYIQLLKPIRKELGTQKTLSILNQDEAVINEAIEIAKKKGFKEKGKKEEVEEMIPFNGTNDRVNAFDTLYRSLDPNIPNVPPTFSTRFEPVRTRAARNNTPLMVRWQDGPEVSQNTSDTNVDIITWLKKLKYKKIWSKCNMVNALLKEEHSMTMTIVPITSLLRNDLCAVCSHSNSNVKISGINAHDIICIKRGKGLQSRFEVNISPKKPSFLSDEQINYVLKNGLFDIRSVVQEINNKNSHAFFYKEISNYKMPKELLSCMLEDMKQAEENKHINAAEENYEDIPHEAFENHLDINNAIDGLEI